MHSRFDDIARYLARRQPRSMTIRARHDPFFELAGLAEIQSWPGALPWMEAPVLDAAHKLLETHAAAAAHDRLQPEDVPAAHDRAEAQGRI